MVCGRFKVYASKPLRRSHHSVSFRQDRPRCPADILDESEEEDEEGAGVSSGKEKESHADPKVTEKHDDHEDQDKQGHHQHHRGSGDESAAQATGPSSPSSSPRSSPAHSRPASPSNYHNCAAALTVDVSVVPTKGTRIQCPTVNGTSVDKIEFLFKLSVGKFSFFSFFTIIYVYYALLVSI